MIAIRNEYPLSKLTDLRSDKDGSFHANITRLLAWFDEIEVSQPDMFLLSEVRMMLQMRPQSRPTIQHVDERIQLIESFLDAGQSFYSSCCKMSTLFDADLAGTKSTLKITIGNTHTTSSRDHAWTFFVTASTPGMIQKVFCFQVSFFLSYQFRYVVLFCGLVHGANLALSIQVAVLPK
jgi:hypothetical protein